MSNKSSPVGIQYKTIKAQKVLSDRKLKELGLEGWRLGGVARQKASGMVEDDLHPGMMTSATGRCFYYHFWREKVGE